MLKLCSDQLAKRAWSVLFCLFCSALASAGHAMAAETPVPGLDSRISYGGYALQVEGEIVRSSNTETSFIPASTIKVLTSLMALEILGPDYRFVTRFFLAPGKVLFIKGEGDPFLTSEMVSRAAVRLKEAGIAEVEAVVLDDSAFALEGPPPGSSGTVNPYDAHNAALAVNFNSLPFTVTPEGHVLQGEEQTPLLPIMKDIGSTFSAGNYRINVSAFPSQDGSSNILRYSGELITTLFRLQGITVRKGFRNGRTPHNARSVLIHESEHTLSDLVRLCLDYSNNFIANQLFLSCGTSLHGFPATWDKAVRAAREYIQVELGLSPQEIHIVEGSGLSTENRISPAAMLTILNRFLPFAHLLKKRENAYLKSGTLTGVYSYVGYFGTTGNLSPFVFFLNQTNNNREALLNVLQEEYQNTVEDRHGVRSH